MSTIVDVRRLRVKPPLEAISCLCSQIFSNQYYQHVSHMNLWSVTVSPHIAGSSNIMWCCVINIMTVCTKRLWN